MSIRDDQEPDDGTDEESKFKRLQRWVTDGWRGRQRWFREAERAYDFVAGHQWSDDDRRILEEQKRQPITFNRTAPIIEAVCGLEVNNRMTVAYLPRTMGDAAPDEARSAMVKWIREVTNAEDEESEAFRDMCITGEGWVETRMDYDVDPKGRIVEERISPLEMGVNDSATRQNYEDARCKFRVRELDTEDAKALFEEPYTVEDLHARWINTRITPEDGGEGDKKDYPDATRDALGTSSGKRNKVTLVQLQWWERERIQLVAIQGEDELVEMTEEEFAKYEQRAAAMRQVDMETTDAYVQAAEAATALGIPVDQPPPAPTAPQYDAAPTYRRRYYEVYLGSKMLGAPTELKMGFNFGAMTAKRDRKLKCFFGMLRDMFDPQMWANKWLSQSLHILNSNAKGGLMAEKTAFDNPRKAEKDWSDPTKIVMIKDGKMDRVKERQPPQFPQQLGDLMMFAINSLRDASGVNLETLGQADREQAASLEAQRRQSTMTILATLFDSKRRFVKNQGRLLSDYAELLPENTMVRVLEQGQYKFIPFIKRGDPMEYDVVIDQTPYSPDQKQLVWATTMQLLQSGTPLPPEVVIKLLKYSPYPESVVQEIFDAMGFGSEMPPEVMKKKLEQAEQALQVMEQQLQEALKAAQTAEESNEAEELRLMIEDFRAETERWKAELDAVTAAQKNAIAAISAGQSSGGGEEGAPTPAQPSLETVMTELGRLSAMLAAMQPAPPAEQIQQEELI